MAGGPAVTLCDAVNARGGTWNKDDVILFALFRGVLFRVPAGGGSPVAATSIEPGSGDRAHRFPWFLPDGHHFLYSDRNVSVEKTTVYVGDLNSKTRRAVLVGNTNVVFAAPGYLLFVRERTLMAQPFNADQMQITGDPFPVSSRVDYFDLDMRGQFSASNGVLAFTGGSVGTEMSQLTWYDRSGKVLGTVGTPGLLRWPSISPDGSTIVGDRLDEQTRMFDLWMNNVPRGTESRFTFGPQSQNFYPVWSPDGSHIAFESTRDNALNLYQRAISGAAQDEILDKEQRDKRPTDWSRDGRFLIEEVGGNPGGQGFDVWVLPLMPDRKPYPYLNTAANERYARLSPNGQWLAYASDETKRYEVYVQTFPEHGPKWQISTDGGSKPRWSRDGKELFFVSADGGMMAIDVKGGPKFEAGAPHRLFDARLPRVEIWYDVSQDGRFLIPTPVEQTGAVPLTVLINWQGGSKK